MHFAVHAPLETTKSVRFTVERCIHSATMRRHEGSLSREEHQPALLTFIGAANPRISVSDFPRKSRETNDEKNRSLVNEAPRIAIIQPRVRQSGDTPPPSFLSFLFSLFLYFTINISRRRGTRLNIYCNYSANCPESSPRGKPREIRAIDYREEHVKCYPVNGAVLISPGE